MRKVFFIGSLFFCSLLLSAIDWPVTPAALISTFGEELNGSFHTGIDLAGQDLQVYPVSAGEVLFWSEAKDTVFQLPSGLGSFVVLEHNRELRSLYAQLKRDTLCKDKIMLTEEDLVGITGDTGNTYGPHLHFALFDLEFDQIINPLLILPPLLDTRRPTLEAVYLKTKNQTFQLQAENLLTAGVYNLQLKVFDLAEEVNYYCPRGIFSLEVYINGEQRYKITNEALKEKDGSFILIQSHNLTAAGYFQDPWEISPGSITLTPGDFRLEIVVKDFSGNESVRIFQLKVQA